MRQALTAQETPTPGEAVSEEAATEQISLITPQFPSQNWHFFAGKNGVVVHETWKLVVDQDSKETYLSCSGQPYGYIRTKKKYRNFDFGLEWRFPHDENGNSGILLFTTGDNRIWPKSIQVQLQQPLAGSAFPTGGAKTNNELRNVPMLSRPVNQWNKCHIASRNGTVTITVNDQKVGTIQDCDPEEGSISLQSEGAEIHFRNIWIKEYPSSESPISKAQLRKLRRILLATLR